MRETTEIHLLSKSVLFYAEGGTELRPSDSSLSLIINHSGCDRGKSALKEFVLLDQLLAVLRSLETVESALGLRSPLCSSKRLLFATLDARNMKGIALGFFL